MMRVVITWVANSLAILFVADVLGLVSVGSTGDAFVAGALLTVINAIVRPIVIVLTLPVTVVTFGLFYFFITGFCLWLTSEIMTGFAVHGVLRTVLASIIVSLVSVLVGRVLRNAARRP